MNAVPNFDEWTREQKEEYAKQRMLEMQLKNAKMMQRHAEVEQDRIQAEEHNSAVTNTLKVIPQMEKATSNCESNIKEAMVTYGREWDIGKADKEYWTPPEYPETFGSYKSSQFTDGKRDWHRYPKNENFDQSLKNRNVTQYSSSKKSTFNSYNIPKTFKETQRKSQKSYPPEMSKRTESDLCPRGQSRSSSSYSDYVEKATISDKTCLWQDDKASEDQNKHERVEKWVKSVNKSNHWRRNISSSQQSGRNDNQPCSKFNQVYNSNNTTTNYSSENSSCTILPWSEVGYQVAKAKRHVGTISRNPSKQSNVDVKKMPARESPGEEGGLWEASAKQNYVDGKKLRTREANREEEHSWEAPSKQSNVYVKRLPTREPSKEEDGLWGDAEQQDIVWKLSDDETDLLSQSCSANDNW